MEVTGLFCRLHHISVSGQFDLGLNAAAAICVSLSRKMQQSLCITHIHFVEHVFSTHWFMNQNFDSITLTAPY